MVETKNFTLRLDAELAEQVRVLAAVENRSMSDVLRDAVVEHVERRRRDPSFRRVVDESRARHEALLRQFAAHEDDEVQEQRNDDGEDDDSGGDERGRTARKVRRR